MRKLATIRKISDIKPIEGADRIEVAVIDGWMCVVKKGDLRFYLNKYSDEAYKLIEKAELESSKTCEDCGTKENVSKTKSGWIRTLCAKCMKKYENTYRLNSAKDILKG